jgi:hypothetical protein
VRQQGLTVLAARALERLRHDQPELAAILPSAADAKADAAPPSDPWKELAQVFAIVARAVHHLHSKGIVHRDISPGNIMLTWPELRPVLMDLGLAADLEAPALTETGNPPLGTPLYTAPERFLRTEHGKDPRGDVYSLGAVAFEVLTGKPVLSGDDLQKLGRHVSLRPAPFATSVAPDVPPELGAILNQALERDPDRRYPTALALAEDFERFADGRAVRARPLTPLLRWRGILVRWRRPLVSVGAGLSLAILLAVLWGERERGRGEDTGRALAREQLGQDFERVAAELLALIPEDQRRRDVVSVLDAYRGSLIRPSDQRQALGQGDRAGRPANGALTDAGRVLLATTEALLAAEARAIGGASREELRSTLARVAEDE